MSRLLNDASLHCAISMVTLRDFNFRSAVSLSGIA